MSLITTIPEMILKELKMKPLTISQLSEILDKEEPTIRTTINRLKEKGLIEETGLFDDKYKIYRLTEVGLSSNLILKMLMKLDGIKAIALISIRGVPISSILPEGVDEMRFAAMTAAMMSLGERACRETKKGGFKLNFIQGEKGKILIVECGSEFVISMSFDDSISNEKIFTEQMKIINFLRAEYADSPII